MRYAVLALILATGGCIDIPAVDAVTGPEVSTADFPALVPLETVLVLPERSVPEDAQSTLTARAEALQARAERLARETGIDAEARARIANGVTLP